MAFAGAYSISQGVDVQSFQITDTSTGSDPNLTTRSISLFKTDNTLLGGAAIPWPLSDGSTKLISGLLVRDFSLNIVVTWTSSSPIPGSTYSKAGVVTFTGNSNEFAYGLLQQIAAQQSITSDNGFLYNLALVNSDIRNADRASFYADQGNAQAALDRIYNFIGNQNFYF
jgi:hypothetical protein